MIPLLIDIPMPIKTERLVLRAPQNNDYKELNDAILESFEPLNQWMAWADHRPTLEESRIEICKMTSKWILREDLPVFIFDKNSETLLGATGLTRINWELPSFEIGYWVRSNHAGKGIITEAALALTHYAFKQLKAVRVEIKCDENNIASRRVAEKLGFTLEGILKNHMLTTDGKLRNTVVYARYDNLGLPALTATW